MKNVKQYKKGFTLPELMTVLIILGILFTAAAAKIGFASEKSRAAGVEADFRSFYTALNTTSYANPIPTINDIQAFVTELNSNLDLSEQFTVSSTEFAISNAKDPWLNNYLLGFKYDSASNKIYVVFSSSAGGNDELLQKYSITDLALAKKRQPIITLEGVITEQGLESSEDNCEQLTQIKEYLGNIDPLEESTDDKPYSIIYQLNGGRNNEANPRAFSSDSEDIHLQAPSKKGFTFVGWTTETMAEPIKDLVIPNGTSEDFLVVANWSSLKENMLSLDRETLNIVSPTSSGTLHVIDNPSGGELSVSSSDSSVATATITGTQINVECHHQGSAVILVTSNATKEYARATATCTVSFENGVLPVTVTNGSAVYTGKEQTAGASIVVNDDIDYTIKYANASGVYNLTEMPTRCNVGTTKVAFKITSSKYKTYSGSLTIIIKKALAQFEKDPTGRTLMYSGEQQALINEGVTSDGVPMYSLTQDGVYSSSIPGAINTGNFTIWCYIKGDRNHKDSDLIRILSCITQEFVAMDGDVIKDASYVDDWIYTLNNTTLQITLQSYNGSSSDLVVYSGYKVGDKTYRTTFGFTDISKVEHKGPFAGHSSLRKVLFMPNIQYPCDLSNLFYGCTGLTTIDFTYTDFSQCTDLHGMFEGCSSLSSFELCNINLSSATDISRMFCGCSKLTTMDFTNSDLSNIVNMSYLLSGCTSMKTSNISQCSIPKVENISYLFEDCSSLQSLVLTNNGKANFNTPSVRNMEGMFKGCKKLTFLDILKMDTSQVENADYMFCDCEKLSALYIYRFNTQSLKSANYMFYNCASASSLAFDQWDTSNLESMNYMFGKCGAISALDLSMFDLSKVKSADNVFTNCTYLSEIYTPKAGITTIKLPCTMYSNGVAYTTMPLNMHLTK